jgi:hypothetical protein
MSTMTQTLVKVRRNNLGKMERFIEPVFNESLVIKAIQEQTFDATSFLSEVSRIEKCAQVCKIALPRSSWSDVEKHRIIALRDITEKFVGIRIGKEAPSIPNQIEQAIAKAKFVRNTLQSQ